MVAAECGEATSCFKMLKTVVEFHSESPIAWNILFMSYESVASSILLIELPPESLLLSLLHSGISADGGRKVHANSSSPVVPFKLLLLSS